MRRIVLSAAIYLATIAALWGQAGQVPNNTVQGNVSGASAPVRPLTKTQATTLCNAFTSVLSGCVPSSGGGTANFLRADGTWTPVVVGPGSSTVGNIPLFNNTTGTLLSDPGIPLSTIIPGAYPGPNDPAVGTGITRGHVVAPLDNNVVFSGNNVFPFQVAGTNPYVIGQRATIASSTVGQIFSLRFASASLTGSPITVSYTAIGGDTLATIATKLCIAVNANATLNFQGTNLPLFCQAVPSPAGGMNLQWNASYTDLVATSTGTGTITITAASRNLDFAVSILGRRIPGYIGQSGDSIHCLEVMGQSTSGAMDAVASQICSALDNATAGNITGRMVLSVSVNGGAIPLLGIQNGVILYDNLGALPAGGFIGPGKLNIPSLGGAGGVFIDGGLASMGSNGFVGIALYGGTAATSSLTLQSTQSGAPTTDSVSVLTNNAVSQKWYHSGGSSIGTATDPGGAGILGVSAKIRTPAVYGGTAAGGTLTLAGSDTAPANDKVSIFTNGVETIRAIAGNVIIGAVNGNPISQLQVRIAADQNFVYAGPSGLADGTGISSLNDAANAFKGLELKGSTVYINGTVNVRLSTNVANGVVATAFSGVGPAGASTTIQEWFKVQNAAGTTRYIPAF